VGHLAEMWL